MTIARRQRTISRPTTVNGFGYFSGQDIRVEFRPASVGTGINFVRRDLQPKVRIPVRPELRINMPRRTTLETGGVRVEMVEHILAALSAMAVDNCEVWVDAAEMPGCDGSALPFVEALDAAGIVAQGAPVRRLTVDRVIRVGNEEKWIEARPPRFDGLSISYELDYGANGPIGKQSYSQDVTPESFCRELAACRTFIMQDVAHAMVAQGLGRRVTPQDLLIFGPAGPIDNELRFPNECARHKVLDVIGDLALTGCEVVSHVAAYRSGHELHAQLAGLLLQQAVVDVPRPTLSAGRRCA
jgi:UDP-3-O-[3-hydroxymyristoyl] N-acetylglucosamine deacetylase